MAKTPVEESNLVKHARYELELLNEEPKVVKEYLDMIRVFSSMGHSGYSAAYFIDVLTLLLKFENLMPLSDNPDEWMYISEDRWGNEGGIWQNRRNGGAFSNDGGKSYYLLSEGGNDLNRKPIHFSEKQNSVPCKWCNKLDSDKPMAFRSTDFCCEDHKKLFNGDRPTPELTEATPPSEKVSE